MGQFRYSVRKGRFQNLTISAYLTMHLKHKSRLSLEIVLT